MRWIGAVVLATAWTAAAHADPATPGPVIHIEDVTSFYRLYDATGGHPSADQLQHDYLDKGSEGLLQFEKERNITGLRIEDALTKHPEIYADARRCLAVLPQVRARLEGVIAKLGTVYPAAEYPPVTIAVGRGRPVAISGPGEGVKIGLEALCAVNWLNPNVEDRFVHVIAHEYIHTQQSPVLANIEQPTVLQLSLIEGAAEFMGEMISGDVAYSQFKSTTKGREEEIENAFVADEDKTDLSDWFNNSTIDKPGDLGYFVGYRVVKSYYEHASDKRAAIRDIIRMSDAKDFLAKSGWYPGIEL
jgi:hypothetical protein